MTASFIGGWVLVSLVAVADTTGAPAGLPKGYEECLGDRPAVFRRANELYERGNLAEAEAGYRFLIENGAKNGYIHYNLGNACFRGGHLGRAIVEYERALQYLPRHPDVRHNLGFVRNLMVDEELKPKEYGAILGLILGLHSMLNLRESLIVLAVVLWLVGVTYSLRILLPDSAVTRQTGGIRASLVIILAFCVVSVSVKAYRSEHRDRAVVLAPASEAKTGPDTSYSTAFLLHEGTTVRLGVQRPGWAQIRLPNGLTGWLKSEDLEVI